MNATIKQGTEITNAVKGIGAEVRNAGFSWRVTISHLGNNGYKYEKFNGQWMTVLGSSVPSSVKRELAAKLKVAVNQSLGRA